MENTFSSLSDKDIRLLTAQEIACLESQGCKAQDWTCVEVHPEFTPERLSHVTFLGKVRLGRLDVGHHPVCGIEDVTLQDVVIGDECHIAHVEMISGYHIGSRVTISRCGTIECTRRSSFGNATLVHVLNESGGRSVSIYDHLTAQEAYMMAFRRYHKELSTRLESGILDYACSLKGTPATIGQGVTIEGVRLIRDLRIADNAKIAGALRLVNGTILSGGLHPTLVGDGVIAENFIISEGSTVVDGAMITDCFIGEACHIGRGFSATESLFFSNCHMEHGEACALFAAPYSVSHHKSTLLIAGITSFFNAGSGSNQSNHSYKLGPNKFGILERGVKLSSGSYLYWPMRVGAFSVVLGQHKHHADLRYLPFSYLIGEADGTTSLVPGISLCSVGVARDVSKWPKRDERIWSGKAAAGQTASHRDFISFSLFNPYVAGHLLQGLEILTSLQGDLNPVWQGCRMTPERVTRGIRLYSQALDYYLLGTVVARLDRGLSLLSATEGTDLWCDYAGLIAPRQEYESHCLAQLSSLSITSESAVWAPCSPSMQWLEALSDWEWNWIAVVIARRYGVAPADASSEQLAHWIDLWYTAQESLCDARLADARKEFDETAAMLYGVDAPTAADKENDFYWSCGTMEENSFVSLLLREKEEGRIMRERVLAKV